MKQFFAPFLLTLVCLSCDDGDLTQVSFEFNDAAASQCGAGTNDFFIYKIQNNRALIIQLPETSFPNRLSVDELNQPLPLKIEASNIRLIYREYSGAINANTMCSTIPVSNPVVVQEREATAGTITITTTAITSEPDANGATQITDFLHTLVFAGLKFDLGDGNTQINEAITQVTYQTNATPFAPFSGLSNVEFCQNDLTLFYKKDPTQALVLDLSSADAAVLFSNEAGVKSILISADSKLSHFFYNTQNVSLSNNYFCANPIPAAPLVIDAFAAENGIEGQSGSVVVTSLASDNGFKHTIVFKKVRLAKGSLKRDMGDDFIFGEFETTN